MVDVASLTPQEKAEYDRVMSEMQAKAGAQAAALRAQYYTNLAKIPYPPPAPPIVNQARDDSNAALTAMQDAAESNNAAQALSFAQQATTLARRSLKRLNGAPKDPRTPDILKQSSTVVTNSASIAAKWSSQTPAQASSQMQAVADQQNASIGVQEANSLASSWASLASKFGTVKLDWRFWTGVGAGIYALLQPRR